MIKKVIPFGTRQQVRIRGAYETSNCISVYCEHVVNPTEMTVCILSKEMYRSIDPQPANDSIRTMEFMHGDPIKGGPMGGYWMILDEPTVASNSEVVKK